MLRVTDAAYAISGGGGGEQVNNKKIQERKKVRKASFFRNLLVPLDFFASPQVTLFFLF